MHWDVIPHKKDLAEKNTFVFYDTVRSFPMLHLAMISKNGTVWDVSLNEKVSPSNIFLFKLPKSCPCGYRGYSDDKGILNFIEGHINQGYRNRYNIIDHRHKKILLCVFSKTYKLWCTGNILSLYTYLDT